ncbi:hypothetical protein BT96DRAFT_554993 [Gymnopus androsaceus JB14]|uniref:Uncharacterized protein n=1 Tax=Gymnopus androsaceus JB14 TaxID=1447944 RepID=A0A6A4GLE6_9AGAR|nr:hypothetical protein BT96DRAFT_554993 [Gymnopus androsaceus JB14]
MNSRSNIGLVLFFCFLPVSQPWDNFLSSHGGLLSILALIGWCSEMSEGYGGRGRLREWEMGKQKLGNIQAG